jgi:hypothetical protein
VWNTPRTWVTGETVTAAQFNDNLRDNFNFVRNAARAYSTATISTFDITTAETIVADLTVPEQGDPYRLIPRCFLSGNNSVASDTFQFRIRADSETGTVLAFVTEVLAAVTGGKHVLMTWAIPVEVNDGGAQRIVVTVQRSAGTGNWDDSGALTGHGRLGALVIPQEV